MDSNQYIHPSYDICWQEQSEDILRDEKEQGEIIQITDDGWEEEQFLDDEEPWIEYSSQKEFGGSYSQSNQQQMILAGLPSASSIHFPLPSDLRQYYCQLHPHECNGERGGLQPRDSNCNASCAIGGGDDAAHSTLLAHVDLSGLGLALLVVVLICLGLNVGWDREKDAGGKRKEKGTTILPENPTPEQVKTRTKLNKAEQELADKEAKEVLATANAAEKAVKSGKNTSEIPESRSERQAREQREKADDKVKKAATAVVHADEKAGQGSGDAPSSKKTAKGLRPEESGKSPNVESQSVLKDR